MNLLKVDHIHLKAKNVERTSAWYSDCFGGEITYRGRFRGSDVHYVTVQNFNIVIYGLLEGETEGSAAAPAVRFGLDHFGFAVPDLRPLVETLRAKKVKIVEEPWTVRPGVHIAYIEGPDGVLIELAQRDA